MAIKAGEAMVKVFADDRALVRGLRGSQRRLRAFAQSVGRVGSALLGIAAAAAVPFILAARTFAQFEDKMAEVRAVTNATEGDFKALTEQAKELGRTTSFTAREVAAGMTELGRAGFAAIEILAAMPAVLDLARGTATELGRAAEITAAALRGFGLDAEDTTRVADVLTATANNSAQTLEDIGQSLAFVAPLAKEANESLEDTAAALGVLANNGIKGTRAGTALARAYKNLTTRSAQKELRKFGVSAVDARGDLRRVADIIGDVGKATRRLGTGERLAIFETLFGRGQAAALKLASSTGFKEMQNVLSDVEGTARRTAITMDKTLGGSFRRLLSATEGVQIALGEAIAGTLGDWAKAITRVAGIVTQFINDNRGLVVSIMQIIAILGIAGAALLGFAGAVTVASFAVGVLATVSAVLGAIWAALATPIGLVVLALIAAGVALFQFTSIGTDVLDFLTEKFAALGPVITETFQGIKDALAAGDLKLAAKVLWAGLNVIWQMGVLKLTEIWFSALDKMEIGWAVFKTSLATIFVGAVKLLANIIDGFKAIWIVFVGGMKLLWFDVIGGIQTAWEKTFNLMTRGVIGLIKLVAKIPGLDLTPEGAEAIEKLEQQITEREKKRPERLEKRKEITAETDERLAEVGQENIDTLNALDKQLAETKTDIITKAATRSIERQKKAAEALRKANEELDAAKADLTALADEAKAARDKGDEEAKVSKPRVTAQRDDVQGRIEARADVADEARGLFNVAALSGLGLGSTAADRTAEATEETADNTRRLLGKPGAAFT